MIQFFTLLCAPSKDFFELSIKKGDNKFNSWFEIARFKHNPRLGAWGGGNGSWGLGQPALLLLFIGQNQALTYKETQKQHS